MALTREPSTTFIQTYDQLLRGLERNATEESISSKHAGLAILRTIEVMRDWEVKLIGRNALAALIPATHNGSAKYISRLHFAIVTNHQSGNRFLIDLGSTQGTTLLDCKMQNKEKSLLETARELNGLLTFAEKRCLEDTIHGDLYALFKTDAMRKNISISITASAHTSLPNPDAQDKIKLKSDLTQFKWYPLPRGVNQNIEIGDMVFTIDVNSTIRYKSTPSASQQMAVNYMTTNSIYAPTPEKPKDKEIRLFEALNVFIDTHRDTPNNYALKAAIAEIDRMGGVQYMTGYPEAFKCPSIV